MSKFGASQRQVITDTNAGKVSPPAEGLTSRTGSIAQAPVPTVQVDPLALALLNVVGAAAPAIEAGIERTGLQEGMKRGNEEGFLEAQRSPIADSVFGKGAKLRGAELTVRRTLSTQRKLNNRDSLEQDIRNMSTEKYMEHLNKQVTDETSKYTDPEFVESILFDAAEINQDLVRQHTKGRIVHEAAVNFQSRRDEVAMVELDHDSAVLLGDQEDLDIVQSDMVDALSDSTGMSKEAHEDLIVSSAIESFNRGTGVAFDAAQEAGLISKLPGEKQLKVMDARKVFLANNDENVTKAGFELEDKIGRLRATEGDLAAYKAEHNVPESKMKPLRKKLFESNKKKQKNAESLHKARLMYNGGSKGFTKLKPYMQNKVVKAYVETDTRQGIMAQRTREMQAGTFEGDFDADPTEEENFDFQLKHPTSFAFRASKLPDAKHPVVSKMASNFTELIADATLTEDNIPFVQDLVNFMTTTEEQMGNDTVGQFASPTAYADFTLIRDMGANGIDLVTAIQSVRRLKEQPEIEVDPESDEYSAGLQAVKDSFLNVEPDAQGAYGVYNKTPENEEVFNSAMSTAYNSWLPRVKGNTQLAVANATAEVRAKGEVANGQFVINGKEIDRPAGYSLGQFARDIENNSELKASIVKLGRGFGISDDITKMQMHPRGGLFNNDVVFFGEDEEGLPISFSVRMPVDSSEIELLQQDGSGEAFNPLGIGDADSEIGVTRPTPASALGALGEGIGEIFSPTDSDRRTPLTVLQEWFN